MAKHYKLVAEAGKIGAELGSKAPIVEGNKVTFDKNKMKLFFEQLLDEVNTDRAKLLANNKEILPGSAIFDQIFMNTLNLAALNLLYNIWIKDSTQFRVIMNKFIADNKVINNIKS